MRDESERLREENAALREQLAQLNKKITDANWELSLHCDAGGGIDALLKWITALRADNLNHHAERETLIYWLLRAYHSGHREGWEEGPSTDETMHGLLCVLANRKYDPNQSDRARQLLKTEPRF